MKIAVLGASGMLGARVCEELLKVGHEVIPVTRATSDLKFRENVRQIAQQELDWIVNCAGVVKSLQAERTVQMALMNAAMPHWLEEFSGFNTSILQVSTDCVFRGNVGKYSEDDQPDPVDLYGATKLAGELSGPRSFTIRTSFVGWEHGTRRGLLEWFVGQRNVSGYRNALWSGLSAREVARALTRVITDDQAPGLFHLAGPVISKYDLLWTISQALELDIGIVGTDDPVIDRTLNGQKFRQVFDYTPPSWEEMAKELAAERPHA